MKLSLHSGVLLFFLFFLFSSSKLCARPFSTEQGNHLVPLRFLVLNSYYPHGMNLINYKFVSSGEDFVLELERNKSLKWLTMEACNSGDEECLVRRMTLEAHIDYIYTEHHKP
ncbi:PREDICTED: phytosulfokines 5-like isoform X2 [Lupinus angustifolius]|uniref:phytosulfokines 5-like isoform X2 n=1 Tax=Lupinus angustifolius TaxID=3871 RepID=UPI00092E8391|nr:PREDICTED: phytosulfokines 5-like isoform X2 [Lupinus angustifolius]